MSTPPPYRMETERLVIRCYQPADAPLLQAAVARSVEHLRPWMLWALGEPPDLAATVSRLRLFRGSFDLDQDYVYGIFSRDESELLGGTGLHTRRGPHALEIGYWVHVDHINRGVATEVSTALTMVTLGYLRRDRCELRCAEGNVASRRIPEKLGYRHVGTLPRDLEDGQQGFWDSMVWYLFRSEYDAWPHRNLPVTLRDAAGQLLSWPDDTDG